MNSNKNNYLFRGKVIEILNHSGLRFIKILCNPESLLIELEDTELCNLGDTVELDSTVQVNSINDINQTNQFN